jgi:prepilin-type N-terminal cleavage/methylation domain-containing protein
MYDHSIFRNRRRGGFTLVELMAVIGIVVLLVSVMAVSTGPLLSSNERAETFNILRGQFAQMQAASLGGASVGIRIEHAFKLDSNGYMELDANGGPIRLPHQRIVQLNPGLDNGIEILLGGQYYVAREDTNAVNLPSRVWLAPDYALKYFAPGAYPHYLNVEKTLWDPTQPESGLYEEHIVNYSPPELEFPYSPLDTFYILFENGQMHVSAGNDTTFQEDRRRVDASDPPVYVRTQFPSARGVLLYDRETFTNIVVPPQNPQPGLSERFNFLRTESRALYVNRFTGDVTGVLAE